MLILREPTITIVSDGRRELRKPGGIPIILTDVEVYCELDVNPKERRKQKKIGRMRIRLAKATIELLIPMYMTGNGEIYIELLGTGIRLEPGIKTLFIRHYKACNRKDPTIVDKLPRGAMRCGQDKRYHPLLNENEATQYS